MASGQTLAKRPISFNGQNLTSPAPIAPPPIMPKGMVAAGPGGSLGSSFSISDAISAAQQGQTAANTANNTRYNQGLGVLSTGANNSKGMIQQALSDTANLGNAEKATIGRQETAGHSNTLQGAINRGIGNTSIVNTLQNGVTRTANDARTGVDDMVAKNRSAINLQGANNENSTANSIAGYIANRNDVAPSLGEYANLVSNAAQLNTGPKSVGTVMGGGGIGAAKPPSIQVPPSVNQSGQMGQYFAKSSGGTDAFSDGSAAGGRMGGAITDPGSITDALSPYGRGGGGVPFTPPGNAGAAPMPDQPQGMTDEQYWQMIQQMGGQYGN